MSGPGINLAGMETHVPHVRSVLVVEDDADLRAAVADILEDEGFEVHVALLPPSFLMPAQDYLPTAHEYFKEASRLADQLLWGSHSLRLSVKTEYAAFLFDCVHDADASRKLAKDTIAEVYDATEGMDDDMFSDACELVTVLGKMMKRGLGSNGTIRSKGLEAPKQPVGLQITPPVGMENPI